ncbi:LacI family DNA-binding transcriptional regulator [Streptomyces sp. 3MP-14]|uniref:LacI family DNA-binding transcriptional regulator n=1 Tax=Streptomyces mimosae TaxID=2586635 RepID=A0A5N6A3W3_9ACTN|nr:MULTISPECIES: LacI family DNA-binding transcriptional regulator [Streptomyces]KAB8162649.1 LacI family DNA-binding transcriptional regulator [Streptomyces mimosae]KAB8174476.1 LacI family DNA-binding transcriptional regulator [Streptomyces sp. 3MP-14]
MRRAYQSATLRDVAEVAGVSPSTASRVLNGGDLRVSDQLTARVVAVAQSLGYVSNQAARALRGRRTAVVLLASDPRTASIAAMAAGMETAGRERGVLVSIIAAGSNAATHRAALGVIRGLRPRALVVTSASFADVPTAQVLPDLERFQADGCSVVFIGEHDTTFPAVRFGDVELGRIVGRFMGRLGRQRPAVLTTAGHPALESRCRGFLTGLKERGFEPAAVAVEHCELSRAGGRDAASRLARMRPRPDLVLAGNDVLAIGAMNEFRRLGIPVPGEIAVSGVDDIPLARDITPALTTVALPFAEAGSSALEMALAPTTPEDLLLPGALVIRESTPGSPPATAR